MLGKYLVDVKYVTVSFNRTNSFGHVSVNTLFVFWYAMSSIFTSCMLLIFTSDVFLFSFRTSFR